MAKQITIDEEIKEIERELQMRQRVYPEWSKGPTPKLKPDTAAHRIACLEATLKRLKAQKALALSGEQQTLFR